MYDRATEREAIAPRVARPEPSRSARPPSYGRASRVHLPPRGGGRGFHILAATHRQGGPMEPRLALEIAKAQEAFTPVEQVEGSLDAGVLVICDHASNAFPPGYGA